MPFFPVRLSPLMVAFATLLLTACGGERDVSEIPSASAPPEGEALGIPDMRARGADDAVRVLSVDKRIALMSAHYAAGNALYLAGEEERAAEQFGSIGPEIPAAERPALAVIGFDESLFDNLATAIRAGATPDDIARRMDDAYAHLAALEAAAETDPVGMLVFLMDGCTEEYEAGVRDAAIIVPLRYETAYGLAMVARNVAGGLEGAADLQLETELLVRMWPDEGPVAAEAVAPVPTLATQASRVKLAASTL